MDQPPDFRPHLDAAQTWVAGLIDAVRPDQLDGATPCTDYDVRALLEHVSTLPAKVTAVAEGDNPRALPARMDIDPATVAENYRAGARRAIDDWADDTLLTTTLTAPWGPAPGAIAVGGFVMETLAHGWDLAVSTGQDPEADPALAAAARAVAERALTDDNRGPGMPFGHRVDPPVGAGPTTELAAFLGRSWSTA